MLIRYATPADASAMARVKVDTWRSAYSGIIDSDYLGSLSYAEVKERFRNSMDIPAPYERFMVVEDRGEVIGFAIFGRERAVASLERGEIYAIYVMPERQGEGVGRKLMAAAVSKLKEDGMRSLTVWTLERGKSRRFYERLGGHPCRTKNACIGGKDYTHVAYCWPNLDTQKNKKLNNK